VTEDCGATHCLADCIRLFTACTRLDSFKRDGTGNVRLQDRAGSMRCRHRIAVDVRHGSTGRSLSSLEGATELMNKLPLAAAWIRDSRDTVRDKMLATLREGLESYADQA
jgi:hypothetical protein